MTFMRKNPKIQALRGLAIVAVVLIHTCPGGVWQAVIRPFINFAVPMFVFLSGYLTKIGAPDWPRTAKKRIWKVIVPYILWCVGYTLLAGGGPRKVFSNLITTNAAPHLYYIFVYIQLVLLTPLLGRILKSRYRWIVFVVTPVSAILYKYIPILSGAAWHRYIPILWNDSCLALLMFYCLGLMLGNGLCVCRAGKKKLAGCLAVCTVLQIAEGLVLMRLGDENFGTNAKITAMLTNTVILLLAQRFLTDDRVTLEWRLLVRLGDWSFGVYLSHMLILRLLEKIPWFALVPYGINTLAVLAGSVLLMLVWEKAIGQVHFRGGEKKRS